MDTRDLQMFLAVAEDLSFKSAAERLGVSQPALSQTLSRFEEGLGVPLFARGRRRAPQLTVQGKLLLAEARSVLDHVELVQALVRAEPSSVTPLKICSISSTFAGLIPQVVPAFRKQSPETQIALLSMGERALERAVLDGYVDVGFARQRRANLDLEFTLLANEPLMAVLDEQHPLASRQAVDLVELAGDSFIFFHRDDATTHHDSILGACARAGFSPSIRSYCPDDVSTLSTVSCGLGVSLMPYQSSFHSFKNVRYVPLTDAGATSPLAVLQHRDLRPPASDRFVKLTIETMQSIARADQIAGRRTFEFPVAN